MVTTELQAGTNVGKYRIERELGRGGMGVVYLAEDAYLSRRVALKVLYGTLANDVAFVSRFRQEAKIVAEILHPNVVRINNLESTEIGFVIDMEYVAGGSLARVQERSVFTPEFAVRIARDVLEALRVCHQHGVIHRDIKPNNILLSTEGIAKLADFGLATAYSVHHDSIAAHTGSTGFFLGTPRYAPPEVWDGERPKPDWDLYSLGLVLYEGLTGKPVYEGATPLAVLKQVLTKQVDTSRDAIPHVSREFAQVIEVLTAHESAHRLKSAAAALEQLRSAPEFAVAIQDDSPTVRSPLPPREAVAVEEKPASRPARTYWPALGVALLVCVAGFAWYVSPAPGPSQSPVPEPEQAPAGALARIAGAAVDNGSNPHGFTRAGDYVFFAADDGIHGQELWSIGFGNTDVPRRMSELVPSFTANSPRHLFAADRILYFCAETPDEGGELYKCVWNAGEGPNIQRLRDIMPGTMGSEPLCIAYQNPSVLFRARTRNEGHELWCTLGGRRDTAIVQDLNPGPSASLPESLPWTAEGDDVFFAAYVEGLLGQQLCRYRFSDNAIRVLHDVSEDIFMIGILGRNVFYRHTDEEHGTEIWIDNLDSGESKLFADMVPGPGSFIVRSACKLGAQLILSVETEELGTELWAMDGTVEGTRLLRDIRPGPDGGNPGPLLPCGSHVIFRADDGVYGQELWATDGTPEGTTMIIDARPGPEGSGPYNEVRGERFLAFSANDGEHGEELWLAECVDGQWSAWLASDTFPGLVGGEPHSLVWVSPTRAYASVYPPEISRPPLGREMCRITINEEAKDTTIDYFDICLGPVPAASTQ